MSRSKIIFITLYAVSMMLPGLTFPADDDFLHHYKIKDLRDEWKVFSAEENALVPYLESINSRVYNIYIALDPEGYRNNGLLLNLKGRSALFINNKLAYNAMKKEQKIFRVDSLAHIYGPKKFLVSIYSPTGIHGLETYIVSYTRKDPLLMEKVDHMPIVIRQGGPIWDFMRLGVIIILIFYVILINIGGRVFRDYYNIINSFIRAGADEFLNRTRNITRIDLVYILVLSLVLSFFIVITFNQIDATNPMDHVNTVGKLLAKWLWIGAIILVWIMLRFFIISLSSDLFKIKSIGTIHTFEYLRITNFYSLLIYLLMVLLIFIFHLNLALFSDLVLYSMVIISVLRAIALYLKFLNSSNYTKLYLFSYLCSAELLPVIIGLRILLKSSLLHAIV